MHQLAPLTQRIGRNTAAWQRAWAHVEALDQEGALTLSHLNIMIAAVAQLPDGVALDAQPTGDTEAASVRVLRAARTVCCVACLWSARGIGSEPLLLLRVGGCSRKPKELAGVAEVQGAYVLCGQQCRSSP